MTTIAYKDGIIAYDSRIVQGITICDDDFEKCIFKDGFFFFLSGPTCDYEKFMNHFINNRDESNLPVEGVGAFVYDKKLGALYQVQNSENSFWYVRMETAKICSIGSGSDHAITAMDMGASAEAAIKMAMKRDTCTGGRIRTFKIFGYGLQENPQ